MQQPDPGTTVEPVEERPDQRASESSEAPALGSASVTEVEKELDAALAKANENYELFLRARAEAENARRRSQEDVAKAHKFAIESFADALVPVVDSLEKALESADASAATLREGVELTLRQLRSAFEKNALAEINPVSEKFDPHRHQAISSVPATAEHGANQVVTVLQKGWMISDRVLRPALVVISK